MHKRRRIWSIFVVIATSLAALGAWRVTIEPPNFARTTMQEVFAGMNGERASVYAPVLAQQAQRTRTETLDRLRIENERWFFLRDYDAVDTLARKAVELAHSATAHAVFVKDSLRDRTEIGLSLIRDRVADMMGQLGRLPHMHALRTQLLDAEAHLVSAQQRQEHGDLLGAADAVERAALLLDRTGVSLDRVLDDYLDAIPEWRGWVQETIAWSKKHQAVSLVVDKMAHRCIVYSNGREVASFEVELGPQWIGPKRFEGDLSTPEGKYFVKRKRGPGETIYYLALEIDYPNDADRRRFADEKRRGTIPRTARLGSNIELHGEGGRTFNWTRGCVALGNPDMRTVFNLAGVGTPVTIVGALEHPFQSRLTQ